MYIGQFIDGVKRGRGKMEWSNGESYDGEWRDDLKHGKGVLSMPDTTKYEGFF